VTDRTSSWYAVALSRAVSRTPHRVLIAGQAFVIFRSGGALRCLTDRCPHRFAPLSLGRVGDPEIDIGRAVAFLVGPNASYITGVTLPIDGGTSYVR